MVNGTGLNRPIIPFQSIHLVGEQSGNGGVFSRQRQRQRNQPPRPPVVKIDLRSSHYHRYNTVETPEERRERLRKESTH